MNPVRSNDMRIHAMINNKGLIERTVKRPHAPATEKDYDELLTYIDKMDLDTDAKLNADQKQQVRDFLKRNVTIFATNPKGPGVTSAVKHYIDTGSHAPIKSKPHRASPAEIDIIHKETMEMLKNKIIRHSSSPWASPVTLAPKPDGSVRFCVDFRKLNAITKKDVYPLPRIDETLERMGGLEYYSSIDLASGY